MILQLITNIVLFLFVFVNLFLIAYYRNLLNGLDEASKDIDVAVLNSIDLYIYINNSMIGDMDL